MEKLGFFQSNLFTGFQKNVYIILWKEVESDCLADLSLKQRVHVFMIELLSFKVQLEPAKEDAARPVHTGLFWKLHGHV